MKFEVDTNRDEVYITCTVDSTIAVFNPYWKINRQFFFDIPIENGEEVVVTIATTTIALTPREGIYFIEV